MRSNSFFRRIGLRNGDTVNAINGHQLTTPDKALEVYSRVRGADRITVSLTRRGTSLELTYVFRDDSDE